MESEKDRVDYGNREGFPGTMEGGLRWSQTSWVYGRTGGVIFVQWCSAV